MSDILPDWVHLTADDLAFLNVQTFERGPEIKDGYAARGPFIITGQRQRANEPDIIGTNLQFTEIDGNRVALYESTDDNVHGYTVQGRVAVKGETVQITTREAGRITLRPLTLADRKLLDDTDKAVTTVEELADKYFPTEPLTMEDLFGSEEDEA